MTTTPLPPLCVWPHPRILGWDGSSPPPSLHDVRLGAVALETRYDTDAHAPGYVIPGQPRQPRVRKSAVRHLLEHGAEPEMWWVFVDVDLPGHAPWPSDEQRDVILGAIMDTYGEPGGPLEAAGIYSTRSGYRLLWALERPIPVTLYESWATQWVDRIEALTGIDVDRSCVQWTRCYRLPHVVRDGEAQSPYVDLSRLSRRLAWTPPRYPSRDVPAPPTAPHGATEHLPDVDPPTDEELDTLAAIRGCADLARRIRERLPLAQPGDRDNALTRSIGRLLRVLDTTDPREPYRYLLGCIEADTTDGAPSVEKLWDRCVHFAARSEADRAAEAEVTDFLERSREEQPLILAVGSRYYVRDVTVDPPTYRGPITGGTVAGAVERYVCPAVPGLSVRTKNGDPVPTPRLFADMGAHVYHTIIELGRDTSEYDPRQRGGTLYEAACSVRRDLTPREHPDVHRWLTLLGGDQSETLLDWLATVTDLSRPTCALYIQGVPGVGKGLFASGVSALWGDSRTSYDNVVSGFNEALTACPVIFADESLPTDKGQFSAILRSLIGERERVLTRKYMPASTVIGAVRLIIGANNADALRLRESLTQDDLAAIAERILHVYADEKVRSYLVDTDTEGWVRTADGGPGKIPEHVAWLAETRQVTPGSRFLVSGRMTDFHASLTLSAGINEEVLGALAMWVMRRQMDPGLTVGAPGEVWVTTTALRTRWLSLTGSPPPLASEIAASLRTLASRTERIRLPTGERPRALVIPAEHVLRVAERLQIGDPDRLRSELFPKQSEEPTLAG